MDYQKLLEDLRGGVIDEFELESDQYNDFYEVWKNYHHRGDIKGIAGRLGKIKYVRQ
ncbi:MAG: hypothetical protein LBM27_00950 [Lactobacillaceae bacterium]|jgi:hypothetical protein|nr:hypothetical protein [Lactobacillaceae bacterium]